MELRISQNQFSSKIWYVRKVHDYMRTLTPQGNWRSIIGGPDKPINSFRWAKAIAEKYYGPLRLIETTIYGDKIYYSPKSQ